MRLYLLILLSSAVLLFSCNKEKSVNLDLIPIKVSDSPIEKVVVVNDSLMFACGGVRFYNGELFRTMNGGTEWDLQSIFYNEKKVYDIYFVNDTLGFAGTEDIFIYKTTDGGASWQAQWNTPTAYHEVHRPIVREIEFYNDTIGYFVGGENYQTGAIYMTQNAGTTWVLDTLLHDLRSIEISSNGKAIVAGHGYVGISDDLTLNLSQLDHPDGNFVSVKKLSDSEFLVLDQNGGLLKFTNSGSRWEYLINSNGLLSNRRFFCDLAVIGSTYLISGDDGLLLLSDDDGESWNKINDAGDYKYNKITTYKGRFYIGREDGSVLTVQR